MQAPARGRGSMHCSLYQRSPCTYISHCDFSPDPRATPAHTHTACTHGLPSRCRVVDTLAQVVSTGPARPPVPPAVQPSCRAASTAPPPPQLVRLGSGLLEARPCAPPSSSVVAPRQRQQYAVGSAWLLRGRANRSAWQRQAQHGRQGKALQAWAWSSAVRAPAEPRATVCWSTFSESPAASCSCAHAHTRCSQAAVATEAASTSSPQASTSGRTLTVRLHVHFGAPRAWGSRLLTACC